MSYDIFYNRQFVKLSNGEVIPMVLAGSNNCYENTSGRSRRSRDWQNFSYYTKGTLSEKPEIILKRLDEDLQHYIDNHKEDKEATQQDIIDHFGYYASIAVGSRHCGGTSWKLWQGQFTNGIKHALSIEELDKLGVNLYFSSYGEQDGKPTTIDIKTEAEYYSELKKWQDWQAQNNNKFISLGFSPNSTDEVLKKLHAFKKRTPRPKTTVEQDHYFVLTDDNSNGLLRYTSRGFKYSYHKENGKRFPTEKLAEAYKNRLLAEQRYKADSWHIEKIEAKCSFLK